ncbi:MAG: glycoside hydrolase [Bacteroidota bacterium]|nr:glycoside hydrolase [Bacteroidota bacterium]
MNTIFKTIAVISIIFFTSCKNRNKDQSSGSIIGTGQMPNIVKDNDDILHLAYGSGDSLMYSYSADKGRSFSSPTLISIVHELAASHTRGPQIAATTNGVTIIACNNAGDIFSFKKSGSDKWLQTARVNDVDTVAKEGLMALSGDGQNVFAVWLDLRDKHNKIFGAKSIDGGKTWTKNIMIYASPDTNVCECCKPSVVVKENNVYVMFRNWLNGNRDLYLVKSTDGGNSFGPAQKLGKGSWALNGCPMDGGGITVTNDNPQTVWRREGKIYACEPGYTEKEIGEGRSCILESVNGKNIYAWTEKGEVVILKPQGMKKYLGKGQQPVIRVINNEHIICVWEYEKQIHTAVLEL